MTLHGLWKVFWQSLLYSWFIKVPIFPLQAACDDDDALRDLGAAATAVTQALHSLITQIREGLKVSDNSQYEEACEVIIASSESLVNALGNAQEMVSQAKRLAEVSCVPAMV